MKVIYIVYECQVLNEDETQYLILIPGNPQAKWVDKKITSEVKVRIKRH